MPAIKTKNSVSTGVAPTSLNQGELAVNITDNKMWVGNAATTPILIVNTVAAQQASSVAITGGTIDSTTITATATSFTSLTRSNAVTVINSSVTATSTDLPTQAAVKAYSDAYDGTLKNIYQWRANGTYTKSGTDVQRVKVICVGGGGGGRGYHESGGAGGYAEGVFDATAMTTVAVTVGLGTAGGVYFGFNAQGGTSSFGAYISATGGYGANLNKSHCGGHGGLGSGGQINQYGGGGGGHAPGVNNLGSGQGGEGGASFFGGGTAVGHAGGGSLAAGIGAPGGGGGSGPGGGHTGQAGLDGIVVVYEFK